LVSAELDVDGMTVDLRRQDGRTLTLTFFAGSDEAIAVFRPLQEKVGKEIERLGQLGVLIGPIESHDPDATPPPSF
jgi:hypothetical protein